MKWVKNRLSSAKKWIIERWDEVTDAQKIMVSVADSGPGVPPLHKQKIFEKFHQVKKGKKIAGQGVGLGLAICTTIIEAHHGSIWVDDNPSGGSVFRFLLDGVPASNSEQSSRSVSVPG